MARTPKPWYWEARSAWYVNIRGKKIKLHEDKKQAERKFHKIMIAGGKPIEEDEPIFVPEAVDDLIESHAFSRDATRKSYISLLGPFVAKFRDRRLDSITHEEIVRFVGEYRGKRAHTGKTIGETTRSIIFARIKTLFAWARDTGRIDVNPLARKPSPWRNQRRTRTMTEEEYRRVMGTPRINANFKEVMEFCWRTGARPGEIAKLEARHLDARFPVARLQPSEHKTGGKTGLQREIYFPEDLMTRLREYATLRPRGALLRTMKGGAWSQSLISDYFLRIKRKLGLDRELVLYMARHAWATKTVDAGHSPALAARMLGHTDPHVLMSVYFHPDIPKMIDIAKGMTDKQEETTPDKPECV